MKFITEFGGQNWVIKPVALAFNEPAPKKIQDQKWELCLSGVAISNFKGGATWSNEAIQISPDIVNPLKFAMNKYGMPMPTDSPYVIEGGKGITPLFQLEQWMPYAALGTIFDANNAVNAGFAVDTWRPAPFIKLVDARPSPQNTAPTLGNIFSGIIVEIGASDTDAFLHRVNYHITLIGKIVFANSVVF
jgi:hypothetical protein